MSEVFVKIKSFVLSSHRKKTLVFFSILLTFWVMMIAFAARGIAPFGKNSLLAMDAYGQYFPMLRAVRHAIRSGSGLEYSFSGSCGFNFWTQNAYYTNSPLWLPLYIVPYSWMPAVTDLIVAARLSIASGFFCLWLMRRKEREKLSAVLFSLCYGLCGWALAFINQFMWADAYMLLPLVALGIDRIFRGKSIILYVLSLALVLWSNFYVGYMVCIFSVIWFVITLVGNHSAKGSKLIIGAKFTLASLLAGGCAAAVLIPTYLTLQNTISSTLSFEGDVEVYHSWWQMLLRLLPVQKTSLEFDAPNLYCGFLCVPLGFLALFSREIRPAKKITYLVMTLFVFISFNFNLSDYIWHGFHYPNQLPGRQSFIFAFLAVNAAFIGWKMLTENLKIKKAVPAAVGLLLAFELAVNSFWTMGTQVWTGNLPRYTAFDGDMKTAAAKYCSGFSDFWRCELLSPGNNNAGQFYGFNGISYYSSTMSEKAYRTFASFGLPIYALNVSAKYGSTPPLNTLLGIRYLFDRGENTDDVGDYEMFGLELKESIGSIKVYENKYALPLGFCVDREFAGFDISEYSSPTELINALYKRTGATDTNLLYLSGSKTAIKPLEFEAAYDKLASQGFDVKSFSSTKITGTVSAPSDCLLFFSIPNDGGWKITVDGSDVPVTTLAGYFCGAELEAGTHSVELRYSTPGLKAGTMISLLSAVTFISFTTLTKKKAVSQK